MGFSFDSDNRKASYSARIDDALESGMDDKHLFFDKLVAENAKRLYRFLMALCKDEALCQDVVQDTFLQAYQYISKGEYQEKGRLWYWLQAIARNRLLGHFRAQGRHQELLSANRSQICENMGWVAEKDSELRLGLTGSEFDGRTVFEKRKEKIVRNLDMLMQTDFRLLSLSDSERKLVCRRHRQDEAFRILAGNLDQPLSTVMSRYYGAMKKIQRQLWDLESEGIFNKEMTLDDMQELIRRKKKR